ncbi:MAG TPA: hypothetical protein VMU77_06835, partial [Acidimicrobiales bacterium]|nr:hypothetical protein [Acidimicrobiales bacterium]
MSSLSSLAKRLIGGDPDLWPEGNVSPTRLGWLDVPRMISDQAKTLNEWASTIEQDQIVLLGMGGSSLGPAVLETVLDTTGNGAKDRRRLVVLDTTDPATIASVDFSNSFMLVSSKSGSTLEVHTLLAHAMSLVSDPSRYAVITDPGTVLESMANEKGFSRAWINPADIGGRYSVLSYFGMVPAALIGYDVAELAALALETDVEEAVDLGHGIGQAALGGRDKVTITVPEAFRSFGLWVEQIIAESTGKQGKGAIPIPTTQDEPGEDRHQIALSPKDAKDLASEFYRWELATPITGHVLGIDPFNEPNVAESKHNTSEVLDNLPLPKLESSGPEELEGWLRSNVNSGDYVSIQAYLPFGQDRALEALRRKVRDMLGGVAATVGYGPRFLHS